MAQSSHLSILGHPLHAAADDASGLFRPLAHREIMLQRKFSHNQGIADMAGPAVGSTPVVTNPKRMFRALGRTGANILAVIRMRSKQHWGRAPKAPGHSLGSHRTGVYARMIAAAIRAARYRRLVLQL
jgi:hypothetical protein